MVTGKHQEPSTQSDLINCVPVSGGASSTVPAQQQQPDLGLDVQGPPGASHLAALHFFWLVVSPDHGSGCGGHV